MRITNLLPLFINKCRVADIHLCWYPLRLVPDCIALLFETGWYIYTYGNQISALTAVFSDLSKVFYVFYDLEL